MDYDRDVRQQPGMHRPGCGRGQHCVLYVQGQRMHPDRDAVPRPANARDVRERRRRLLQCGVDRDVRDAEVLLWHGAKRRMLAHLQR
jgi:hypothetical protein